MDEDLILLALATGALGSSLCERYWKRKLEDRVARLPGEEASRSR